MRPRILVLPASAIVIVALCVYKSSTRVDSPVRPVTAPGMTRLAPAFEFHDETEAAQRIRLASYLGRHSILVVFYNGQRGADHDPLLNRLRDVYEQLQSAGIEVFAVSTALPQETRKVIKRAGSFGYPLLSDPGMRVHREWGRYDEKQNEPLFGAFLIDRAGRVAWAGNFPKPLAEPERTLDELLSGN